MGLWFVYLVRTNEYFDLYAIIFFTFVPFIFPLYSRRSHKSLEPRFGMCVPMWPRFYFSIVVVLLMTTEKVHNVSDPTASMPFCSQIMNASNPNINYIYHYTETKSANKRHIKSKLHKQKPNEVHYNSELFYFVTL